jgi:hypothetical protein
VEGVPAGGEPLPDVPEGDEGGGQGTGGWAVFQGVSGQQCYQLLLPSILRWLWSLQIIKKTKGAKEDETDYPSFGYAQAGRSHVKMYVFDEYGIDLGSPLICPDWRKWWNSYQVPCCVSQPPY